MLKLWMALSLAALAWADDPPKPAWALSCALVPGWAQSGPARAYEAGNLFEYMDGNAEGYLIYGFRNMKGVTCRQGEISFVIDLSDMGDVDGSYGMFSANRDPALPTDKIGMAGQVAPRRAMFVKGRWYVEIAANPEGDHTAALRAWLRLSAMVATSRASGRNMSRSGTSWRNEIFPVRRARIHSAARAIGPVMLQRTINNVIRTMKKT